MITSKVWAVASLVLVCFFYSSNTHSDVNQYGVDCSVTPWMSSCGDDWTTQDGMTEYNISDDSRVEIDLPFTFPFQGNNYVKSWMYSNGVVGFMSNSAHFCCNGIDVANGDFTNYTGLPYFSYSIAALWTDLRDYNVDVDGDGVNDTGFFTQEVDTNNNGQTDTLRYLWRNISEYGRTNNVNTFGTEINSSGGIEIHHFDINITNHAVTVGVFGDVRNSSEIEQYEYYSYNQDFIDDTYSVYTFNLTGACQANPLISTLCDGYAEAYATLIYNQSCAADALYDVGCPGYASAYYDQQCSLNQLYDSGCPFYAEAYYDQQCSLDPLYDSGCTGYASAYYDQQCSLDPLYDSGCTGYDQAYYEEYVEPTLQQANETAGVEDETTVTNNDVNEDIEFASNPVETITSVEVTGDATVDQILRDNTVSNPVDVIVEMPPLEIEPVVEEPIQESVVVAENESSTEESEIIEIAEIEESIDEEFGTEVGSEESTDEEQIEEVAENEEVVEEVAQNEEVVEETSENSEEGAKDKKKSKKDKMREIVLKKASSLADDMSTAATLDAQKAVQQTLMSLINYVPDFIKYGGAIQGGYYADASGYEVKDFPQNPAGLRNGLAQQILHEKMVEMQYNNK